MNPQTGLAHNLAGCTALKSVHPSFLIAQVMHEVILFVKCSNNIYLLLRPIDFSQTGPPSKYHQLLIWCIAVKYVLHTHIPICSHAEMYSFCLVYNYNNKSQRVHGEDSLLLHLPAAPCPPRTVADVTSFQISWERSQ